MTTSMGIAMNTQKLLEQFLGPNALSSLGGQRTPDAQGAPQSTAGNSIGDLIGRAMGSLGSGNSPAGGGFGVPGGALGGLAAGGLLGVLLGQ